MKATAVPTVGIPKLNVSEKKTLRSERFLKREREKKVAEIMLGTRNVLGDENVTVEEKKQTVECVKENQCGTSSAETLEIYKEKYIVLFKEFEDLQNKYIKQKQLHSRSIKKLHDQIRYYKNKNLNKSSKSAKEETARTLLQQVLTKNQIALLSEKKKRVNWTNDEISIAFTLRYYSKKSYLFLKNKLHYPLPALSTLRNWASKIDVSEGILRDILLMLKLAGESFTEMERTVILQFDEVKVKATEEYDVGNDKIIGPHNQMQVVMARGLFAKWKQPVYIGFDVKMTKNLLLEIIDELHKISFNVVGCVSDCGASNVGLWKELGVNIDTSFFQHPITQKNIYMFADAPHLLKLLRNWLLDVGFKLEDGSILNKQPLDALMSITDLEVSSCWKVNKKHINCEKSQRQNVRLAAQLLSNTVATSLIHYKPGTNKEMAEKLGNFISDVNYWFDIFNSYCPKGKVPTKHAYGIDLKNQENHLNKMIKLIGNMRANGKNTLQVFQKGMLISMNSLKNLFNDLRNDFKISYICTHRLNQDSLENFFFQIRSRGGPDEHPTPLSAIYRMRMIMLGKNPGIYDAHVNTVDRSPDEYILPKVLETAKVQVVLNDQENIELSCSSSFSSSSSNQSKKSFDLCSSSEEVTHDALEYIAGYLAKKFQSLLPHIGDFTHVKRAEHSYNLPSWIEQLSYGGLIKPTEKWLQKIKKWNHYFESHHGESLRKTTGVVKNLAKKIFKKEKEIPLKVIQVFCKLRTKIRMNFRNLKAKENKLLGKRKSISVTDEGRKKIRKLSKITT